MNPSATLKSPTCCLLTPPGVGAIAVIAVRGAQCESLVRSCVSRPSGEWPNALQPGRLYFGIFADGKELIDEVIVCPLTDGDGKTIGVDISAHGGIRVVERILMALTSRGAELIEADDCNTGVQCRIESDAHRRMLRCTTRRSVMFLMAQAELLPAAYAKIIDQANAGMVDEARVELKAILDRSTRAHFLHTPARIAVVGPPNAGKSSLVNALADQQHVIVTDIEGTTRDWVTVPAVIDGIEVTLVDTAGTRETHDDLERAAIQRGRSESTESDVILAVFDGSTDLRANSLLADEKTILVLNKSDLGITKKCRASIRNISNKQKIAPDAIHTSAKRGDGIDALRKMISTQLGLERINDDFPTEFEPERLQIMSELYRVNRNSGTSLATQMRDILGLG
ncbi:MAG: GTP-binding protein [Planctomycetes bacterium]|nr:GTP-binding protein [Planctomycetota bacterium]